MTEGARLRVAVVAYHASPLAEPGAGDAGGMTVYVRSIAEELARSGVHTDIFTRADGRAPRIYHLSQNVRVVAIESGPRAPVDKERQHEFIEDFVAGARAFAAGQRVGYDIIHSHYWQSGVAAARLARAWNVPLVHSHHTLGRVKNAHLAPGDEPESSRRLEGEAQVIAAADVLVASTDEEWKQLACLYGAPQDRVKTLHPGVDHDLFTPGDRAAARASLGFADEAVLLYVGRIQRLKGIDLAIEAVEELVPAIERPVRLLIAGGPSGPAGELELERLRRLARVRGVDSAVSFIGAQPHDRLPNYYRAADAVVVCSHSESFGLVGLEAHACGTPVVATAVGGLSYIVREGESGYLVSQRDPSVFAARLKQLLSDDELRRRFSAGAIESARTFSWTRTARSLLELYECLSDENLPEVCTC
ncbi:MAG TPA: glycosyltransferase [Actinomycetota bacterium]|nr:glycosyltransferase [Actinomycetota bacterium]